MKGMFALDRDLDVTSEFGYEGHMACGRKARYRSRSVAEKMALRRMRDGAPDLRAYRCPYCGSWHLTKRKRWT